MGYATIGLRLTEVYKLSEVEQPAIGFGAKMAEAFRSGASRFARGFENFLLGVARGWIGWLIFLIIVVVVVLIVRKIRRRRKARAAAAPRPPYPPPGPQPQQQPNPRNPEKPGE